MLFDLGDDRGHRAARSAIPGRIIMKTDIHPEYSDTTVKCSCGNTFTTKSTRAGDLTVELCNECHPFFTGKQKLVDSGGRDHAAGQAHRRRRCGRRRRREG